MLDTRLSTLRDPTQLRQRQCASYAMSECKKTQILIAHQKEGIDQTKKNFLAGKKSCLEDFARINGKLTAPSVMFEPSWQKKCPSRQKKFSSSQKKFG